MFTNMGNVNIDKIKLIIWDLDNTFWNGTLAENDRIHIHPENLTLVKSLAERGIISSICSKNDYNQVVKLLSDQNINNYFVFKSINFEAKGPRIKNIINEMNLKNINVLFIDDNPSNLAEAKSFCPDIMVSDPSIIPLLIESIDNLGKDDSQLDRLKQYQVLETKYNSQQKYKSVDKFLKKSNIKVSINHDCMNQIDRISELILRTNQLNYTKKRLNKDELIELLNNNNYDNAYITCKDKFGDYGIIGFISLNKESNTLEHFLFSCRTMGMGIESCLYQYLHFPYIAIVEPVTKKLERKKIDYITILDSTSVKSNKNDSKKNKNKKAKIFLRGPCDLDALLFYLGDNDITAELAYVGEHKEALYQIGHSQVVLDSHNYISLNIPFAEDKMYETKLYSQKYAVVILSVLAEAEFGVYENSEGKRVIYGECYRSMADQFEVSDYQNGFSMIKKEDITKFLEEYKFIGRISVDKSISNYEKIIRLLPNDTKIFILLGPENTINNEKNNSIKFLNGNDFYKELNHKIKCLTKKYNNLYPIEPNIKNYKNRYFSFESSTHYPRITYYKMAKYIKKKSGSVKTSYHKELKYFLLKFLAKLK